MVFYNKNKNELLTLTGAVYSFVAYLTAFTLEVLFIIDLARQNSSQLLPLTVTPASLASFYADHSARQSTTSQSLLPAGNAFDQARLALESMQSHITISCLAISILYFLTFVASLILIVALILRSTFFILVWLCIMATLYLPEFGLIIYVSVYGWGLSTRNGQTELMFYVLRATLNVIFIFRAYKLFKNWNYEKNFLILKSSSANNSRFTGYDSPYFIGDSLTTTINPVFSTSTLNLDRYDQIRSPYPTSTISSPHHSHPHPHPHQRHHYPGEKENFHLDNHYESHDQNQSFQKRTTAARKTAAAATNTTSLYLPGGLAPAPAGQRMSYADGQYAGHHQQASRPRLAGPGRHQFSNQQLNPHLRPSSSLSINDNDDLTEFEMDLDYRTLTNQRHHFQQQHHYQPTDAASNQQSSRHQLTRIHSNASSTMGQPLSGSSGIGLSPAGLSYSTQSLDRRHLRDMDLALPEHVILRPLGHQPFDYLRRPGSSSNLATINTLNSEPSGATSGGDTKTGWRSDHYG